MFRKDLLGGLEERSGRQSVSLRKGWVDGLSQPDDLGDKSNVWTST
jgi:hypothetical protein